MRKSLITAILVLILVMNTAQAATIFGLAPDTEKCDKENFELGHDGSGEYIIYVNEPGRGGNFWVDSHYINLIASKNNIVNVPLCFNSFGRTIGDSAKITAIIETPDKGNKTYEYGVCVTKFPQVNKIGTIQGDACSALGGQTSVFSAGFAQEELYAEPGETVTYRLVLSSSISMTVGVSRASSTLDIKTSSQTLELGSGTEEMMLQITAPSSKGDYPFSVMVSAQGCDVSDCKKEVSGVLHVTDAAGKETAKFYIQMAPNPGNVEGKQTYRFKITVNNYGPGQEITVTVGTDDGLDTSFVPYKVFMEKGSEKSVPLSVTPSTDEKKSYKIRAVASGADDMTMAAEAWLNVNEMVSDLVILGEKDLAADLEKSGLSSLEQFEDIENSVTGNVITYNGDDEPDEPEPPNYMLYALIAGLVIAFALIGFFLYKRIQVQGSGGPSWESLGAQ